MRALAVAMAPLLEPETPPGIRNLENIGLISDFLAHGTAGLRDLVDEALQRQPGTDRLMLIVDQWEELYTLTTDDNARGRFIEQLLEATTRSPLSVVLTLRGDFYSHAVNDRPLADRLQDNVVNLGPMTREELQQAITRPVENVQLSFEPGLVHTILNDVGNELGNLPLLEFAVTALWDAKRDGLLTHDAYREMRRVQGAMANRAETIYNGLRPLEQEAAKRAFLRLVRLGEATEDTRRRASFSEIGEAAKPLIRQLADARLLVTGRDEDSGEETIDVAHEALIQNWSRLQEWLDQDREFLLWRQRLRSAVATWERHERRPGFLLLGAPLTEAERWLGERPEELAPDERSFIQKSVRRDRWRRNLTLVAAISVAMIMTILAAWAWRQSQIAQREERLARARLLVAQGQAEFEEKPLLGLRLAIEGLALLTPKDEKIKAFTVSVIRELAKSGRLLKMSDGIAQAYPYSKNSLFILGYTNKPGEIYRFADSKRIASLSGRVDDIEFSPDKHVFVVDYVDAPGEWRHSAKGELITTLAGRVGSVWFSPDASVLGLDYRDAPDELRRSANGELITTLTGRVGSVWLSPAGSVWVLAYEDAPGELRHSANGELMATLTGKADEVRFGANGVLFKVKYEDNRNELWDTRGTPRRLTELGLSIRGAIFEQNHHRALVWHSDGRGYYLDIDWLQAMEGDPAGLPIEKLVQLACQGPLASGLFAESALKPYLEGRSPQACNLE